MQKHLLSVFSSLVLASAMTSQLHGATHTWTGGGGNGLWSTAANWSGGAPTAVEAAPVNLIFPGNINTTNNIVGLTVDSVVFSGSDSTLHGSGGGTLTFRGAGGTNLNTTSILFSTKSIASTLPVTINGSNYFHMAPNYHFLGIHSVISGSGTLTLVGQGHFYFHGTQANTLTGKILVSGSSLHLSKTAGVNAVAGPVDINTENTGGRLNIDASNQVPDSVIVTVNTNGAINLYANEGFANLNLASGRVDSFGGALLTLTGDLSASGLGNLIGARTSLGGATRNINTVGTALLSITGAITNGSVTAAGINKTGPGRLELAGTNEFTGAVTVTAGSIQLTSDDALGSTAGGVVINSGSELILNEVNIGAESITLNGTLTALSTNTLNGPLAVNSESTIHCSTNTQINLAGVVSGSGPLLKTGGGTLLFSGSSGNNHSGGLQVSGGFVTLNKSSGSALLNTLTIDATGTVRLLSSNQIANTCAITVNNGGTLSLNNFSDTIGSLAGAGSVNLGQATLTLGGNNASTTFSGIISGSGAQPLVKVGGGIFVLSGTNTCTGISQVNAGTLQVDGSLPGPVLMSSGGGLWGNGRIGNLLGASGNFSPGVDPLSGKFTVASALITNSAMQVAFDIFGSTPGTGYDQLVVQGNVQLNNPLLTILSWTAGGVGNQYVLIDNDGADAVVGTFNGLPEGATFTAGLQQFSISYQGGTGNDVVLTQIGAPPGPQITSVAKNVGGSIDLTATGLANTAYVVEATTNLNPAAWQMLDSVSANGSGVISFTDSQAPNHSMRFYRLKLP